MTSLFRTHLTSFGVLTLASCSSSSSSPPAPMACDVELTGNVDDDASAPGGCADLTRADGGGDYVLTIHAATPHLSAITFSVDLGGLPAEGVTSSNAAETWSADAALTSNPDCVLTGGSLSVPSGAYSLDLTSAPSGADGGGVHGVLDMQLSVHSPPMTDCGAGDSQSIRIVF